MFDEAPLSDLCREPDFLLFAADGTAGGDSQGSSGEFALQDRALQAAFELGSLDTLGHEVLVQAARFT